DKIVSLALLLLFVGDIPGDLRDAGDFAACRDGRYRQRNIDQFAAFGDALGFKMFDGLTGPHALQNIFLLLVPLFGDDFQDRLPDHFRGRIAKNLFRGVVPAHDDAVQCFADNGVVGTVDDGDQLGIIDFGRLALGDIQYRSDDPVDLGVTLQQGDAADLDPQDFMLGLNDSAGKIKMFIACGVLQLMHDLFDDGQVLGMDLFQYAK